MSRDRNRMKSLSALVVCLALSAASTTAHARNTLVEIDFDDDETGRGAATGHALVRNHEGEGGPESSNGVADAYLRGNAVRTSLTDGRYGRGARISGGTDAIELRAVRLDGDGAFTASMWVNFDSVATVADCTIVDLGATGSVRIQSGRVVTVDSAAMVRVSTADVRTLAPGFHHVGLYVPANGNTAELLIDFTIRTTLMFPHRLAPQYASMPMWVGLRGVVDELIVFHGALTDASEIFDLNPATCTGVASTQCQEFWFPMRPRGYGREMPVRVKFAWNPARCSARTPCPLVVTVSAGGSCPDDYDSSGVLQRFVEGGFIAATVDVSCEPGDCLFAPYPHITSELVEVVRRMRLRSDIGPAISAGDFFASGASAGGTSIARWAMLETEHPRRTFMRSPGALGPLCNYQALSQSYPDGGVPVGNDPDTICPGEVEDSLRTNWAPTSAAFCQNNESRASDMIRFVTPALTATREIGISWGIRPRTEPICLPSGMHSCFEIGRGFAPAARMFRDRWEAVQPVSAPSGFFFENQLERCHHTLPTSPDHDEHWDCINCFLRYGRAQMPTRCASCMRLPRGAPEPLCTVCDTLPLTQPDPEGAISPACRSATCVNDAGNDCGTLTAADGGPDAGTNDGAATSMDVNTNADANSGTFDSSTADGGRSTSAGCGCRTAGVSGTPKLAGCLAALAVAVLRRRRKRA